MFYYIVHKTQNLLITVWYCWTRQYQGASHISNYLTIHRNFNCSYITKTLEIITFKDFMWQYGYVLNIIDENKDSVHTFLQDCTSIWIVTVCPRTRWRWNKIADIQIRKKIIHLASIYRNRVCNSICYLPCSQWKSWKKVFSSMESKYEYWLWYNGLNYHYLQY